MLSGSRFREPRSIAKQTLIARVRFSRFSDHTAYHGEIMRQAGCIFTAARESQEHEGRLSAGLSKQLQPF